MKRSFLKLIKGLLRLIGPYKAIIALAVFNGTLGFILAMNITVFAGLAILKMLGVAINISYPWLMAIIIISGIFRGIVRYFEQYSNHYMAFKLLAYIRLKLYNALRKLGPAKLDHKNKGEIISLLQSDIETLEVFYAHTITPALIAFLVSTVVVMFLGFMINWYVALVAVLSYLVVGILVPVIFYKKNHKYGQSYRQKLGLFEDYYLDSIYGNHEIISQNKGDLRLSEVARKSEELLKINDNLEKKNVFFKNVTNTIIILANVLIIMVGYLLYQKGVITNPYIILAYMVLTSSFGSVVALAALPNNLAMTFASGNRVLDLLEEKSTVVPNDLIKEFSFERLTFSDVCFKYHNKPILNKVNLEVKKGEIVGVLGKSGAGKSTILKLMMHFYNHDSGDIFINDVPINDYALKALYKEVNLFSQTTYLFADTILNNLLIAKPNASMVEIKEACANASILKFIENLPLGFDTKISDLQDNISQGEKQRLGLARIFLKQPKLLLLDEATSNVDALSEEVILNSLKKYAQGMAIVIISHRKSTLNICERIYELKDGILC